MTLPSKYYTSEPPAVYAYLDEIVSILGATKQCFWPILSGVGTTVLPYGLDTAAGALTPRDEVGAVALEAEFDPVHLPNGLYALYNEAATNNHLNGGDDANYSHGNGTVDTAFSLGLWVLPFGAGVQSLIAKYGSTLSLEEFDLRKNLTGSLILELHDASASASEVATGDAGSVLPSRWNFCVATYDGEETAPDIHLYVNGVDTNSDGASVETGAYVAMEDTAAALMVGARDAVGTPAQEYEGILALPFITGKELTAAEVSQLYRIGKWLIGL